MLVVISFLILFFISFPGYFTMSPALHPRFSGPWRPPTALTSTPATFDCLFFFIYSERYGFEWAFFTHRLLYLTLLRNIFGTTCFYQGLPGSQQFFLEVCRAAYSFLKHRPGPSVCFWFTVIHNPLYILNLYLCMSIFQKVLLVVKTLIKNIIFFVQNNHENIKQQPH